MPTYDMINPKHNPKNIHRDIRYARNTLNAAQRMLPSPERTAAIEQAGDELLRLMQAAMTARAEREEKRRQKAKLHAKA